ncbi:hypothetical protein, partial [Luteimonas rhizosphaerae]
MHTDPSDPVAAAARLRDIASLLRADAVDAAIEAGLMQNWPAAAFAALSPDDHDAVATARAQLQRAWAARERYRTRSARLARRAAERDAQRAPPPAPAQKPALPSAAAAIL